MKKIQQAQRIEIIFAGMHSSYWVSLCAFSGFIVVYLSYYGFTDTQIGITASLIAMSTIIFQLSISTFSDARPHIPLKRIILTVYLIILALITVLTLIPLPLFLMLITYAMAGGLSSGIPGLYNAQVVQFINAGIPVDYGWPRGVSALMYAIASLLLGMLLENYQASILMPICILCLVLALSMVMFLPMPQQVAEDTAIPGLAMGHQRTTMKQLLSGSKVLRLFLLSSFLLYMGLTNTLLFLPRVVEMNFGNKTDLGLAMFIQAGVELPAMAASPIILKKIRTRTILVVSLCFYLLKSVLLLTAASMVAIYIAMALNFFCFGLYGVASVYFVNDMVRTNEKVRAQTLVTASGALANMIGSLGAGWLVDHLGITRLNLLNVVLVASAAVVMIWCAYTQTKEEIPD